MSFRREHLSPGFGAVQSQRPTEVEQLKTNLRTFAAFKNWKFSFQDIFWVFLHFFLNFTLLFKLRTWFACHNITFLIGSNKACEYFEAFYVVRLSNFVEMILNKNRMNLFVHFVIYDHWWCSESAQLALACGSCNFENFQNITRAHKSRKTLAFIRFPSTSNHCGITISSRAKNELVTSSCACNFDRAHALRAIMLSCVFQGTEDGHNSGVTILYMPIFHA